MFNKKSIFLLIAMSIGDYAHADLTSGLAAYYPFNGNANDASGNGNNLIVFTQSGNDQLSEPRFTLLQ